MNVSASPSAEWGISKCLGSLIYAGLVKSLTPSQSDGKAKATA